MVQKLLCPAIENQVRMWFQHYGAKVHTAIESM